MYIGGVKDSRSEGGKARILEKGRRNLICTGRGCGGRYGRLTTTGGKGGTQDPDREPIFKGVSGWFPGGKEKRRACEKVYGSKGKEGIRVTT